jgi:hypothetical protein
MRGALRLASLAAALAVASAAPVRAEGAKVLDHTGRWESGYGSTWYNVVGRVQNTGTQPLRWVKLRIEALDGAGKAVASTETYNESAEVLTVPEANPKDLLTKGKVKPLPAGATERFRGSFLKEETPAFATYRVTVVETPAAE